MINKIKIYFSLFLCLMLFANCKNERDDYFAEPDWLEKPLYQVLRDEGHFNSYLACIDRTLYADQLKEGGYCTLMAPNDEAFSAYMQAKGYATVNDIPIEEVKQLVAYSILQSYWLSENLGDLFRGTVGSRYDVGDGLKKQTSYYATLYKDPDYNNSWVIDQNTNSSTYSQSTYNYKYYPVFMESYFSKSNLTAADYNVFYPNSEYVGGQSTQSGIIGNLMNGQIIKPNLKARNGIAHEVSVVNLPVDNMDKFLQKDEFKTFKSLLDFKNLSGTYVYKNYLEDITLTEKYKLLRPNDAIDKVLVKSYNTSGPQPLSFSPAVEAIYNDNSTNTLSDGYTLFVPKNEVLTDYINKRLLKYYHSLNDLPVEAITTLINTHMANTMIWPSQLKSSQVSTGEYTNGEGAKGKTFESFGILNKNLASNGFIYTIDHVIKSKLFETVYAEIFLNPANFLLNTAYIKYYQNSLRENLMKSVITGFPNTRYTVLLMSDNLFRNDGFTYNAETGNFSNALLVGTNVTDRIRRLMQLHLFEGWVDSGVNAEVTFQDGVAAYGGWGFRNTSSGDVIRYKDNKLQASGNIEENSFVTITKGETFDNGTVYTVDKLLQYSKRETSPSTKEGWNSNSLWFYLQQTAQENTNVTQFVEYVQYALKSTTTDELAGISENNFYTILMPNNNALTRARANGDLPSLDSLKNATLPINRIDLAVSFLKAHFLEGIAFPDDKLPYLYPYNANSPTMNLVSTTSRFNNEALRLINQRTYVIVSKDASGTLSFTPDNVYANGKLIISGSFGMATPAPRIMTGAAKSGNNGYRSNRIAGRAIHHEFTNYFKFVIQK